MAPNRSLLVRESIPVVPGLESLSQSLKRSECPQSISILYSDLVGLSHRRANGVTMSAKMNSSGPRIFYGWIVIAAAFAVSFVGFGGAYTFSAFVEDLQKEFGASRGSVSLVFSLSSFLYFGLGIVSGPLADRWGARRLAVCGMMLVGMGFVAASRARSLAEVYAAYGLGVGIGLGLAFVPTVGAVQRWFVERRGFAAGLAASGISAGMLVMPPLATLLIKASDWRDAYLILGCIIVIIGTGMALLIKDDPRDRAMDPDDVTPPSGISPVQLKSASVGDAIRSHRFIRLYAACLICSFAAYIPFVHLVPYARDHGIPQSSAIFLLGTIGVGSTTGRLILGNFADRVGRQSALALMFLGMALALIIWAFATTLLSLAAFAFAYGVFFGGLVALLPALAMDYFGGRNISSIIGILYTSIALGALVGPAAAGYAFDLTGSYMLPIFASICANIIAACLCQ
jgi:MFS family permease